jgi:hypothetical protein
VVTADWEHGDHTGLSFPAHAQALRDGGTAFLDSAFRAFGVLGDGNRVVSTDRFREVAGGSTGRKGILDVSYTEQQPDLPTELFVKFSRDFDDPVRDRGRSQMAPEVRFASLAKSPAFPIAVPTTLFADYHGKSGTGLMITERITFGDNGIEPQHHKCLDYRMPDQLDHYRALLTAVARLAGTHRSGRLPEHLAAQFPVDLEAATVGEHPAFTSEQLDRRVRQLTDFIRDHPGLFAANLRSPQFGSRLIREAHILARQEDRIWNHLRGAADYLALCHWNANVDNAWFWRGEDGVLQCGLMDWGCVSQMNVAMAIWGSLSGAETDLWDDHLDDLLVMFCNVVRDSGGPAIDPDELRGQLMLYATLMGITWLLDVPALLRKRLPDVAAQTTRHEQRIADDEGVRAPLQMLTNVLNLWETRGLDDSLELL